jgi:ParB family transcriptional regulator, chromosome partitioning protein
VSQAPRKALGRGLDALLGERAPAPAPSVPGRDLLLCPVEDIRPAPGQPRVRMDERRLEELADSIRQQGVIEPLLVRRDASGAGFLLIAGERRWRAAQRAGLREVPVVVREATAREAFELALVENLQRQDLDPVEEALAYRRLVDEHGYTQERVAERVGRERSTVANAIRLLGLPEGVRRLLESGQLSAGHARALLALGSPQRAEALATEVVRRGLSVRATEALVRAEGRPARAALAPTVAVRDLEARLRARFATRVRVSPREGGRGRIEITYHSLDELDRLLELMLP